MGDLVSNGEYYFVENGNGGIKANNGDSQGLHSTVANSYIKLDLSEYSEDEILNITVNAQVSSESPDYGYATITESETAPTYSSSTGRFIYISGTSSSVTTAKDYSTTLTGGKVYYLHFGYRKDVSVDSGNDNFTINSITLSSDTMLKPIQFYDYSLSENTTTYTLKEDMNKEFYVKAIYEDGTESSVSQFEIKIDKTAPVIASILREVTSETTGKITVSDIVERGSGVKGYYISTEEAPPTVDSSWVSVEGNSFEIDNLKTNTKYYIWLIDNANNISEMTTINELRANYRIDNSKYRETLEQALSISDNNSTIELLNDYTDSSIATVNKNIILNTGDYTLTRTQTITISGGTEEEPIIFELNGKITTSSAITTLTTKNYVTIRGTGIIENTYESTSNNYRAVYNSGTLVQEGDLTISGYYIGLYNENVYTLNSGKVENIRTTSGYGIYNYSSGDIVNINGGEVNGYYGIYNYTNTASINMSGGSITGINYGIYARSSGTININGGYISGTYGIYVSSSSAIVDVIGGTVVGSTYGIYGYTTGDGKITIGDINIEVNQVSPVVSGGQYGIYMRNNNLYNFYNGIIMGTNTKPYTDTVNPREGYMVYTYYDYNNARKYCAVLTTSVDEIEITHTPTEWTNQDVTVEIKYPMIQGSTLQYSKDGENWEDITNGNGNKITTSENTTIYARMLDESGIVLQSKEHEISNIDKITPEITIDPETTKYIVDDNNPTVNLQVTANVSDEGGSGLNLRQYGWSDSKEKEPSEWIDFGESNSVTITKNNCSEGTYYLWFNVTDNAGNKSDATVIRYIIEYKDFVAKSGENYYYTIQDAIDAVGTTPSTIEVLKDTDEISIVKEGQDITLELNGHTVGSSTSEQATFTNNGTLTIKDNSEEKIGTIENLVGTAIKNNGTLTIGDNSSAIDDNTPTITGNKSGIKNTNTLNYYDGTIIGKSAIDGNVQKTPESYGPVGVYEDGMTIVNLRVVSDYVARIDWFYYSTLQSAFDACTAKDNNTEQTTIHMLKDIILDNTVTAYNGQNIRLNFNGHMLTNINNTILENNGNLEITDLTEEKNGNITSSVIGTGSSSSSIYKLIINNGYLNISEGTILSEQNYNTPIYNRDGTVEITGGSVTHSSSTYTYGVYNYSTGIVNVIDGEINSDASSTAYGIYNNDTGIINVTGGTINVNSINSSAYGIYNRSTGIINVMKGTISSGNNSYDGGRSNYAYGIYNYKTGAINVIGGEISSSANSYSNARGIYNDDFGIINIEGGIVRTNSNAGSNGYSHSAIGIVNDNGTVKITAGTVSVSASNNAKAVGIDNGSGIINVVGGDISSISNAGNVYGIDNGTGTINIDGGNLHSTSSGSSYSVYGIYNSSTGTINITEGEISSSSKDDSAYGIYNYDEGTINVIGGKINSNNNSSSKNSVNGYGIYNYKTGVINVIGGKISSSGYNSAYGIYNSSTGTITIGIKGDNVLNTDEPNITVTQTGTSTRYTGCGIRNTKGMIYFYDGVIQSSDILVVGGITEIEDNCQIIEDEQEEYKRICLSELTDEEYIIENVINKKQYTNLRDAINDVTDNENELKIMKDFTLGTEFIIPEDKNIILDLNGKVVINAYFQICNYGNLEITDSVENGKIQNENVYILNDNNGNLFITGGEVSNSSNAQTVYGIYNNSTGTINVTGGEISSSSSGSGSGNTYGIYNDSTGTINVTGGKISSDNNSNSSISSSTKVTYGIYNSKGTINITEGEINSSTRNGYSYGIYNGSGTINVTGGEISSSDNSSSSTRTFGIYNSSSGVINMEGGKISSTGEGAYASGIYNNSTGIINVTGGEISSNSNNYAYGIYNYSRGTINIIGGEISSSSKEDSAYGIYNSSTGTITIGNKGDGIISTDEPNIIATYTGTYTSYGGYGIANLKGILNFYDGRIEGSAKASYDDSGANDVEEIQTPQFSDDRKIYAYGIDATDVARIRDKTYLNLQDAINEATESDVIEILRGIQYTKQDVTLTIGSDRTITIDLQNNPIISAIENPVFTVEGNLRVIDTVGGTNGRITSSYENTIYVGRYGTLEVNGGTINNSQSRNTVIENEGIVNITGGTISQANALGYAINNTSTGTINIFSGVVEADQCGIYSTGEINIIGGTVGGSDNAITNTGSGILNIENGVIEADFFGANAINNQENANINMSGGEINISTYSGTIYGINNTSTGTINLTGGTISVITTSTSTSYKAYGIYSTAGIINVGTKDRNIDNENPSILGITNGIYTSEDCTLNIYDGIIKGEETAINGNIASLEEQSEIVVGEETDEDNNTYETISLVKIDSPIASVDGTQYYSLKEAFDNINGTGTIQILRIGTVGETINIPSDKNVTIDLNGNTLNMYTNFINNGTLKITDEGSGTGVLTEYKDKVIDNNGTFELLGGTISGITYGIYNNSNVTTNISVGTLINNVYGIYNLSDGSVNVTN